jgi:uncharacterized membrane protein YdcZ (DUF606 family)
VTLALSLIAFLLGAVVVPALAWLVFVYPYSDVSLWPPALALFGGVVVGCVVVVAWLCSFAEMWPGD